MDSARQTQVWRRKVFPLVEEFLFDQPDLTGTLSLELHYVRCGLRAGDDLVQPRAERIESTGLLLRPTIADVDAADSAFNHSAARAPSTGFALRFFILFSYRQEKST